LAYAQAKKEHCMAVAFQKAREAIERIKKHRKKCLIIHYACQSLYDDKDTHSPRIANIVVKGYDSDQTFSFAFHLVAEKLGILKADIPNRMDDIERRLLDEFFDFVRQNPGNIWLHWNMTSLVFGFETLAHRFSLLTGKNAPSIDMENRVNLAEVVAGRYGPNYAAVPHIPALMELNGGIKRDFVPGAEEVELFRQGEFARLHSSTVAKVGFFREVVDKLLDRKLKTRSAGWYVHIERATDHVAAKAVGIAASIYTFVDLVF
jgi:hypothetical protein